MRKIQKAALGVLAGGVLLAGIGTGVALVEYSTLNYGGHKIIGENHLVTNTFTYQLKSGQDEIVFLEGFDYNASRVTNLIEDETIPKDEIHYEVTYNDNRVRPYIWSGEGAETIRIGLGMEYFRNEFADFMEVKDLVLSELKQHKVSTYETTYVTNVAVKANPETMSRIEKVN